MKSLYNNLIKLKSTNLYVKFFRFAIVGGFATLVDIMVYHILTNKFDINHLLSNPVSFVFGLIISYYFSRSWVFNGNKQNFIREFMLFTATSIIGFFISEFVLFIFIDCNLLESILSSFYNFNEDIIKLLAKVIASLIVLIWNFFTKSKIVFKS